MMSEYRATLQILEHENKLLRNDLKVAVEALEFYGDKSTYYGENRSNKFYTIDPADCEWLDTGIRTGGKRARVALEQIKKKE